MVAGGRRRGYGVAKPNLSDLSKADLTRIYRSLRLIRRAEEEVARIYPTDKIKSPVHLSIGQESVAVGVCDALRADDAVSGTYRGHATYLAKGGNLKGMFAELYGKATGCARGKGGSMHLVDMAANVLGTSAVVGTTVPIAMGYALAYKRRGKGQVVAAFFGDGATEEGVFYESLNFASLHRLPMLFVCENNFYAIHTPQSKRWATDRLCERVETFGIPAHKIADGDVFAIRSATAEAVAAMRSGASGPVFIEAHVYRWKEHVGPGEDYHIGYRGKDELERWRSTDQVESAGRALDATARAAVDREVETLVAEAIRFAEESPFPEPRELMEQVYAS
ncbi:MAG: thiamine pyrophosphate-dependent dehydrogenase E1 component subunit alpha [Proteobacteria bacterium]|nr:thiamine pyrophosphate-dependent dehydrogenase E1 component subunit alpha [Pseudomonadota bacterium]MBI3498800.1 thiamine pyrophosphate-dependent dehydrogenase E1 component subunit alpha [Pseudomonadota bacterium]